MDWIGFVAVVAGGLGFVVMKAYASLADSRAQQPTSQKTEAVHTITIEEQDDGGYSVVE